MYNSPLTASGVLEHLNAHSVVAFHSYRACPDVIDSEYVKLVADDAPDALYAVYKDVERALIDAARRRGVKAYADNHIAYELDDGTVIKLSDWSMRVCRLRPFVRLTFRHTRYGWCCREDDNIIFCSQDFGACMLRLGYARPGTEQIVTLTCGPIRNLLRHGPRISIDAYMLYLNGTGFATLGGPTYERLVKLGLGGMQLCVTAEYL